MARVPNSAIGECECPIKGCSHVIPVYKYRGGDDPKKRRFAGRLYGICPTHSRVENSEYFLCNADIASPKNTGGDASNASANPSEPHASNASPNASEKPPTRPAAKPMQAEPSKQAKQSFWERFKPIIQ